MDMEKYTSGKIYAFFEWVFRLATWNLLLVIITLAVMAGPYYVFYKIQDNNKITSVEFINDDVKVVQNNGRETTLTDCFVVDEKGDVEFIKEEVVQNNEYSYIYKISLTKFNVTYLDVKDSYTRIYLQDFKLYGENEQETKLIDSVLEISEIKESTLDKDMNLVIKFENKELNFGRCVETQSLASSIWLIISIVLGLFVFIPCFVTVFSMIKIYGEGEGSNTIILFFDRLWDNFKSIYKLLLLLIPIAALFVFSTYYYYSIISGDTSGITGNWVYVLDIFTISYNILLVTLIILVLWLLNLPMTLGYFRMRTKDLFKFTLQMTFRNILYTFIYLFAFLTPILLCIIYPGLIAIWFVFGISLPLYVCYLTSRSKYRYLVRNLEEIQREMKENTEIYRFNEQEKGDNHEVRN